MRIFVSARPGAREDKVEETCPVRDREGSQRVFSSNGVDNLYLKVWVKDPPKEGKANAGIIKILSGYFSVPPSRVRLIAGATSRQKVFDIVTE